MHLHSLKIHGFKSFFDKTSLEFHPGVTAIVGPNGCGKSNVVDAIRWVLGESSARALRGLQMTDVISNGTDTRKALGLAEVTLTLTHCEDTLKTEFHEISITRRIYRDGKNEYFLNQQRIRLKDLQHLLLDTGLGRPAYSILEQGKIDLLLSAKPEDRRLVFEEAAGIAKFKNQKQETLAKLKSTQENLIRIKDILSELRVQRDAAHRHAQKASQWQNLAQLNQFLETHHLWHEANTLLKQREELQKQEAEHLAKRQAIEAYQAETTDAISHAKATLQKLSPQIQTAQHALLEHQNQHFKSQQARELNLARKTDLEQQLSILQNELCQLEDQLNLEQKQLFETTSELETFQTFVAEQQTRVQEQQKNLQRVLSELESVQKSKQEAIQRRNLTQADLKSHQEKVLSHETQLTQQAQLKQAQDLELSSISSKVTELETKSEALRVEREATSKLLTDLEKERRELQDALQAQQAKLSPLESQYQQHLGEQTRLRSKLDVLDQLLRAGETLGQTEQRVLKEFPDKLFSLTSFLSISNEQDLPCLEAALLPHEKTLFALHHAEALEVIQWIQERYAQPEAHDHEAWNRVSILGLPHDAQEHASTSDLPEGISRALDLVHVQSGKHEALAQRLARHLLGNTLVADHLDLLLMHRATFPRHTWVTRDGLAFYPDQTLVSHTASREGNSLLRLEAERKNLNAQVEEGEKHLLTSQIALDNIKALIEHLKKQLLELEQCKREQQTLAQQQEQLWKELIESLTPLKIRLGVIQSDATSFESLTRTLHAHIQHGKEHILALEIEIRTQEDNLQKIDAQEAAIKKALNEAQSALEVSQKDGHETHTSLALLAQKKNQINQQMIQLEKELSQRKQRESVLAEKLETLQQEAFDLPDPTQQEKLEKSLKEKRAERKNLQDRLEQYQTKLEHSRREHAFNTERAGAVSLEISRIDLQLRTHRDQLHSRHQISLEHFQPDLAQLRTYFSLPPEHPETEIPWNALEQDAKQTRADLDQFGPVNLDAISEFAEIEERYQALFHQEADLESAQQNLKTILEKIEDTTRDLFEKTFAAVKSNFQTTFAQLFGESSHADLVLQDSENPLDCGIEIIAKPPGKRLQSITLLSGGERSMTAVALLFSIYLVKPSPFCILDELDAPLDESNLSRFLNAISIYTPHSQFIIVTHNKQTMARADVLYGITMEESGISRPYRLQLPELEDVDSENPPAISD